jgi:hydrogenase expression/formation protein HypC
MCIALPAQVLRVEPGHAWVDTREGRRRVSTALVGDPAPGDWLLVFLDSARSVIDAARAAEVEALLDLVQAAMGAPAPSGATTDFDLPSRLDSAALARLTGQTTTAVPTLPLTPLAEGVLP